MDTETINSLLFKNSETRKYYMGCFPADKIPKCFNFPCSMVINIDPSHRKGRHWVAIFIRNPRHLYYFDSFGLEPEGYFKKYLETFDYCTRYVDVMQSMNTPLCGHYCIYFLYKCSIGVSFQDIINEMAKSENSELLVRDFVLNMYNN